MHNQYPIKVDGKEILADSYLLFYSRVEHDKVVPEVHIQARDVADYQLLYAGVMAFAASVEETQPLAVFLATCNGIGGKPIKQMLNALKDYCANLAIDAFSVDDFVIIAKMFFNVCMHDEELTYEYLQDIVGTSMNKQPKFLSRAVTDILYVMYLTDVKHASKAEAFNELKRLALKALADPEIMGQDLSDSLFNPQSLDDLEAFFNSI